ncbi:hypothetical protein HYFRA_00001406 [Hymenoscyphus fraxineus]|uniref:Uncharacterized protein n=1 Tax=Hymenoscyphus fraxineus TaxID=746836 RepID=A0A9N9L8L2_9HELO|nr:hypothetical protein HYFRA_00001406 [Hymenoscyphus fraxineus]
MFCCEGVNVNHEQKQQSYNQDNLKIIPGNDSFRRLTMEDTVEYPRCVATPTDDVQDQSNNQFLRLPKKVRERIYSLFFVRPSGIVPWFPLDLWQPIPWPIWQTKHANLGRYSRNYAFDDVCSGYRTGIQCHPNCRVRDITWTTPATIEDELALLGLKTTSEFSQLPDTVNWVNGSEERTSNYVHIRGDGSREIVHKVSRTVNNLEGINLLATLFRTFMKKKRSANLRSPMTFRASQTWFQVSRAMDTVPFISRICSKETTFHQANSLSTAAGLCNVVQQLPALQHFQLGAYGSKFKQPQKFDEWGCALRWMRFVRQRPSRKITPRPLEEIMREIEREASYYLASDSIASTTINGDGPSTEKLPDEEQGRRLKDEKCHEPNESEDLIEFLDNGSIASSKVIDENTNGTTAVTEVENQMGRLGLGP